MPAKISVIIVTFNAAPVLQNCLDSIFAQAYPNLEVVVKDGGSTDGTLDIIKANAGKIAVWKSEKDGGIYDAMNIALSYATGDWVYFIGADDELYPGFSDLANELQDASKIYYGRVLIKGQPTPGPVDAYKHAKDTICHQAIIYPASVFKKYQFDTRYPIAADHVLNMQCWADKNYSFEFADLMVAHFNDTGVSMTQTDTAFKRDQAALVLKYHGFKIWARFKFRKLKEDLFPKKYKP
ncbi:glycosyltransferase family 2 protein [Mucilaginibacter pedocola]|uniref:Glycosyltransferase n=1 Tax=Mucilaginibacter pedocola TaxID=1792845 RepID=A0A1S9PID9_9SPHI|nr:glycosyltransferase family 2 protein [Mucilaginibacter pedocola]OOQ60687.1 glycosyltransferase [Mucilaginibacter pedocola]